jgi:hypothetical protein
MNNCSCLLLSSLSLLKRPAKVSDGSDGAVRIAEAISFFSVVLLFWVRSEIMDELFVTGL